MIATSDAGTDRIKTPATWQELVGVRAKAILGRGKSGRN